MTTAPAIDGELLGWLESNPGTPVRLPVVIHFGDEYRLDYGEVFVGTRTGPSPDGAIHLELDDGGMSIGLFDLLRERTADGNNGMAVWLQGRWGALVPMPGFDDDFDEVPHRHAFSVFELLGDVAPGTTHIEVAAR